MDDEIRAHLDGLPDPGGTDRVDRNSSPPRVGLRNYGVQLLVGDLVLLRIRACLAQPARHADLDDVGAAPDLFVNPIAECHRTPHANAAEVARPAAHTNPAARGQYARAHHPAGVDLLTQPDDRAIDGAEIEDGGEPRLEGGARVVGCRASQCQMDVGINESRRQRQARKADLVGTRRHLLGRVDARARIGDSLPLDNDGGIRDRAPLENVDESTGAKDRHPLRTLRCAGHVTGQDHQQSCQCEAPAHGRLLCPVGPT